MKHINVIKRKDGMALITVVVIFLVLIILLGGIAILTNSNLNQSISTRRHTAAYYAAEAGITTVDEEFTSCLQTLYDQSPPPTLASFIAGVDAFIASNGTKRVDLTPNNNLPTYAIVTLSSLGQIGGFNEYLLQSVGYVGDTSRTLTKSYRFKYTVGNEGTGFVVNKAVMTENALTLSGGAQVIGAPVSSYSTGHPAITLGSNTKVLSVELDPSLFDATGHLTDLAVLNNTDSLNSKITSGGLDGIHPLEHVYPFPEIVMPTYPNKASLARLPAYSVGGYQLVNGSGSLIKDNKATNNVTYTVPTGASTYYVPELIFRGQETFTIDVGDTDKYFVVDKLQLDGYFRIIGNGRLTIYVTGNTKETATTNEAWRISMNYPKSVPVGSVDNPSKFLVYIDPIYQKVITWVGSNQIVTYEPLNLTVSGSAVYYMSLMAANLNMTMAGSGLVNGYVVTGGASISIKGSSSIAVTLYYAPNAVVSLGGGGRVNGAILCDSFDAVGNGIVTYSDIAFENFPFQVLDPITGGTGNNAPSLEIKEGATIES